jgi:hypothetical protein
MTILLTKAYGDEQSLAAQMAKKNAMLGHSLFLISGKSWIV